MGLHDCAETTDADRDQQRIGARADRDGDTHVIARQAEPQHVGILRADRDDQ